ncbi:MAG: hypothetical protein JSU85_07405 [Candidatus Zixiibacteriota bacterium]|nr:MAG: hypothetical protein JSU85_07405 [candidate division Zixibacteria bacterium]
MKINGFNNKIPPTDINPKTYKSIDHSASGDGKTILKNADTGRNISTDPGNSERIDSGKDRIELNTNRAVLKGAEDSGRAPDIKDSIESGERAKDVIYSPESVSGAAKTAFDASREIKFSKVRQKIADGYYDNPEFIERLAEKLIEKFYLSEEKD